MANNTDEIKKIKKEVKTIEDTLAEILKIVKADEKDKPNEAKEQGLDEDKVKELFNEMMSKVNANLSVESPKKEVLGMDRDVLFISLCLGTLNLSTARNGGGEIYTFHEFGEEQMIPYSDAKNIIKNNKSFIKGGKVFIDDEDIIQNERLTKDYEKILDYKGLSQLFKEDVQTFEKIFQGIPRGQQESFADILIQKIIKGEKIDRNLIYIVNQELNIDIEEKIQNGKNLME
jgi:hypothetical protein